MLYEYESIIYVTKIDTKANPSTIPITAWELSALQVKQYK